mmetsp:Transcript_58304/g.177712  ORF Transcript_58304/g.177712 Transcript_58304/m.177712 type:complete len:256 (+) Transcript_58304:654-1421(+)
MGATAIKEASSANATKPPLVVTSVSRTSCERARLSTQLYTLPSTRRPTRIWWPPVLDNKTQAGRPSLPYPAATLTLSFSGSSSCRNPLGQITNTFCVSRGPSASFGRLSTISKQTAIVPNCGLIATCLTVELTFCCFNFFRYAMRCWATIYMPMLDSVLNTTVSFSKLVNIAERTSCPSTTTMSRVGISVTSLRSCRMRMVWSPPGLPWDCAAGGCICIDSVRSKSRGVSPRLFAVATLALWQSRNRKANGGTSM